MPPETPETLVGLPPEASPAEVTAEFPAPSAPSRYPQLLGLIGFFYLVTGAAILFFPNEVFYLINIAPTVFKLAEPIPNSVEKFWLVPASALMATLALLSFASARSPGHKSYAWIHVFSKAITAAGFGYMFFNDRPYFAYLLGLILESFLVVLLSWKTLFLRTPST